MRNADSFASAARRIQPAEELKTLINQGIEGHVPRVLLARAKEGAPTLLKMGNPKLGTEAKKSVRSASATAVGKPELDHIS